MSQSISPPSRTEWFTQSRFGMFIHWGTYALGARHEWLKRYENMTHERYQRYFEHFEPDLYDPRKWAAAAKKAGMRYVVLTAKHHEGFCLWNTAFTDYKATNTPYGRDLLTPYVEAFRAEGLKVGFYYSLIDWHHPDFTMDVHYPRYGKVTDEEMAAYNEGRDMSRYAAYMRDQVRELLTNFGKIDLMWFDFSYPQHEHGKGCDAWESEKLHALVRELQPDVLVDNRLDLPGSGDFTTPEQFQPSAPVTDKDGNPVVWEACQTFSGSWGYHRDEMTWKSPKQLIWMLVDGISKGGNLLLNVGPNARGELDERTQERLEAIGEWMRLHNRAIYGCVPAPAEIPTPADCRYTYNPETNRLYLHVFNWPFRNIHLGGLTDKIAYAQLLNDASEVLFQIISDHTGESEHNTMHDTTLKAGNVVFDIPTIAPNVEVPVIEIFLK